MNHIYTLANLCKTSITAGRLGRMVLLLSVMFFASQAHAMKAPDQVVRESVDSMVSKLQSNHGVYKANEKALHAMLEETLLPALHLPRMTSLILGKKHSKASNRSQKAEFTEVFKQFILNTYATGLLDASGKEKVIYKPVNLSPGADKVTVEAELVTAGGDEFPIILFMSNRKDTKWRAYNIEVAGVNFIRTYRSTFKATLDAKGIDGLIADLKAKSI